MEKLICVFLLALSIINSSAQSLNKSEYLYADLKMVLNVKQFYQFIKRFNYTEDFTGNKMDADFMKNFPREKYIHYLFNAKDPRLDPANSDYEVYNSLIEEFIQYVDTNTLLISRSSENIFVEAQCNITYKNQEKILKLLLKQEMSNGGLKWVIHDVLNIGDIVKKDDNTRSLFIPPTSNELNFTYLQRVFNDKENFRDYLKDNFRNMPLNILLEEVEKGNIEYQHVKKMIYHVFDIDGWLIRVEEFIRNDVNSGWLISNIEKWSSDPSIYFKEKK